MVQTHIFGQVKRLQPADLAKSLCEKTGTYKEAFAIALMVFCQKCYGVFIDNVTGFDV